ncbi:DUF4922 domain-containing protein [Reinekea marina]|uniref:DUF4922 domain-containing protein n=1 Tax=Reinekea marina TaxID=1310421 RepID=A0ABV7WPT8_9GAMM|nr:DUF4922 domain-containing protein [Reinekea marina]MDN3647730.1 DUF4922 domain-containing protein [Reinekea marina]
MNDLQEKGLWQKVRDTAKKATLSGHLIHYKSILYCIESDGNQVVVRIAPELSTAKYPKSSTKPNNPFLPPEPELTVTSLCNSHNLVLNKYSVIPNHCLLTTQEFVSQTDQLHLSDFKAIEAVLREVDGLVFYNGGREAGASQSHRHFQLVQKDLGGGNLPIERIIERVHHSSSSKLFPFEHRFYRLPNFENGTLLDAWQKIEFSWQPYNLLITRDWMLVIPRRAEKSEGMSVNALGFAGALLAKNEKELQRIQKVGYLKLLGHVCFNRQF